jgi:hypothetical protein
MTWYYINHNLRDSSGLDGGDMNHLFLCEIKECWHGEGLKNGNPIGEQEGKEGNGDSNIKEVKTMYICKSVLRSVCCFWFEKVFWCDIKVKTAFVFLVVC